MAALAKALNAAGPILTLVGASIQFYCLKENTRHSEERAHLREYIDALFGEVQDITEQDLEQGRGQIRGQDIGEMFGMLRSAAIAANKENRRRLRALIDGQEIEIARLRKWELAGFGLVILGTMLWATGSFV